MSDSSGSHPPSVRPQLDDARFAQLRQVTAFLVNEVHLLDDRRYEDWLKLFTEDCVYWMPVDPTVQEGALRLNVFRDDRGRIADRVARLLSGSAHTEDPPPLTVRTVSAVQVLADEPDDVGIVVRSNFVLLVHRGGTQQCFGGRYQHRLIEHEDGFRIVEKRVGLLGSDAPQRPLTFLF